MELFKIPRAKQVLNDPQALVTIFAGAVLTDMIIIFMNYYDIIFVSKQLQKWYKEYRLSAMIMDVFVIVLYVIGGVKLLQMLKLPSNMKMLILTTVFVQIVLDLVFYAFYTALPSGTKVFDFFKDYTNEISYHALWSDAVITIFTLLFSFGFKNAFPSPSSQWILLIFIVYVSQYILHLK